MLMIYPKNIADLAYYLNLFSKTAIELSVILIKNIIPPRFDWIFDWLKNLILSTNFKTLNM